jgi:hypothetical protein
MLKRLGIIRFQMYPFAYLCQRSFLRRQSISEKWLYCSLLHSQSAQCRLFRCLLLVCAHCRQRCSLDSRCCCWEHWCALLRSPLAQLRAWHGAVVAPTLAATPALARRLLAALEPPESTNRSKQPSFRMQHQSLADCMSNIEAVAGWLSSPREQEAGRIPVSCPCAAVGAPLHLYRAAATAPLSCAAAAERCMNRE